MTMMEQPRVKLSEQPWECCDCGGMIFEEKVMFKRISGILTGQPEAQHVPVQVIVCTTCNKIPSFIHSKLPEIPAEIKAKGKLKLNTGTTDSGNNPSFTSNDGG